MDFQCKHSHNYDDILFHIFADCLMPAPRGTDLEHNMCQALILLIKENTEKVKLTADQCLKKKKLTLDAYIVFMEQHSYWGDEIPLHLLAIMNHIHYCIITKTKLYYSHLTAFPSPGAMHIALVYLGNSIFRDTTTLSKKCPLPPHIDFNPSLPSQSESEYAQESAQESSLSTEEYVYGQESPPRKKG